ncbi:ubiquitin carboxyl-terminal hydrolase 5 [Phlebotomus papatasi]|uniref:ubiquitin carboxyl-terminal hydrolase 5 n=1 Tax=Phlebotomus papatasi TaxID=29031 RepID=UPI0024841CAB|nr:ubiquitin carboxyl-terminal hydrolase 5 [Phlebotomus papatasi]
MDDLQSHLARIRVPSSYDNIFKDECVYSFDTPETETGLYVCLNTFLGFGKDYVLGYYEKTKNAVFLHIRRLKTEIPPESGGVEGPEKKITRLAIGIEGGFDPGAGKKYTYEENYSIVVLPGFQTMPYSTKLPQPVVNSVSAILAADSAMKKAEKSSLTGTWDGEVRHVSACAKDLLQLDNGRKIPPSGWKCDKCELTTNLWLNLTDGAVLCGRRFFDGSGGNDHAVLHYKETGYPLAVKLGTITSEGKGDVYSYEEDDMVEDPYLVQHLAHFGIKINQMEKTEKSMVELELDLNQRVGEWSLMCESGSNLTPMSGPGCTGMQNLGNSCYLNSVMQVIFTIPDFVERFVGNADGIFAKYPNDPASDFNIQMAKLGVGLLSGKYSSPGEGFGDTEPVGISPAMFKTLIGKDHPEFSTKLQQDAHEFYLHLVTTLEKNSRGQVNPADALKYTVEERLMCSASGKVRYSTRNEWSLPLQIPLHLATNIPEIRAYEEKLAEAKKKGEKVNPNEAVRPKIPFTACLNAFTSEEIIDQFYSTAIKDKTRARKITRLATMPDFLMIHFKKFTLNDDWSSQKLDVSIDVPDELDLSSLRAEPRRDGEELLPEIAGQPPPLPPMDEQVLEQLVQMGFPPESCKKAIFFTKNTGVENATQWIMEHITDADFSDPFVPPGTDVSKSAFVADANGLQMLMGMGFNERQATKALRETGNNIERAADWIFSHQSELDAMETSEEADVPREIPVRDGGNNYKLVAFISHMGTSAQMGHYICHILKDNQWLIFNDNKVAISQNPPKDLGYLYLYRRV